MDVEPRPAGASVPRQPWVFIDADACPVKEEVYRVAARYAVPVRVVANAPLRVPAGGLVELVVRPGFGSADDWIAEEARPGDIVITADIPLAARALAKAARVLDPRGNGLTANNIAEALALRELLEGRRRHGEATGGPAAMTPRDRSRFLSRLDEALNAARRGR
jgi:uncharacterized protein YaiI (UPF0178 family)